MQVPALIWYIYITCLGLVAGSFATGWLWALYTNTKNTKGRSKCRNCNNDIKWYDLFPVLSWLFLHGKCRYCQTKLSLVYPLIEVATAILFFLTILVNGIPNGLAEYTALILLLITPVILVVLFFFDLLWQKLPNQAVFILFVVSLLFSLNEYVFFGHNLNTLLLKLLCGLFLFIIFYGIYVFSKGRYIGGGDVKLIPILGVFLSFEKVFLAIFLASVLGSVVGITLISLNKKSKRDPIPFGPFLVLSLFIFLTWGDGILSFYSSNLFYPSV